MNSQDRNRSSTSIAAAERAHHRATGGTDLGDVAIYILMRTCNIMMNERVNGLLEPYGLTAVGYITLMALFGRVDNLANPSELSDLTGETRGNMTRICDDLVDKGLMRRVPNAEDRRRVDLSLSDEGVKLLTTLVPHMRSNADAFYERAFTKTERESLQRLLTKFSTALAEDL